MQTEDRVAKARAFRRRAADLKMAADLQSRGFIVEPPRDEIQRRIQEKAEAR